MTSLFNLFSRTRRRVSEQYQHSSVVLSFNHDGLEIARVKNEKRWLPIWHVAVFLYLVLLIRLIAIADVGAASYANRMEKLENGSFLEWTAAKVMQMDPISRGIATSLRGSLREMGAI
jgi:hypothetical protein